MHFVPYLLYLFLIAFYRTILADFLSIGPVEILLVALIVIMVALDKDYLTSLWFGFAAGLIYDAPDPAHFGVHMVLLSFLGILTVRAKERFNLESRVGRVLLIAAGLFVYAIPYVLIYDSGGGDFLRLLLRSVIPSVLYTSLIAWIFFVIKYNAVSRKKLKPSV